MFCIFITEDGGGDGNTPIDIQGFIKDTDASIGLRVIKLITLVLEHSLIAQNHETMGKALGNKELAMIIFCKFYSYVLTIGWRTFIISTATSNTAPLTQRTILLWVYGGR